MKYSICDFDVFQFLNIFLVSAPNFTLCLFRGKKFPGCSLLFFRKTRQIGFFHHITIFFKGIYFTFLRTVRFRMIRILFESYICPHEQRNIGTVRLEDNVIHWFCDFGISEPAAADTEFPFESIRTVPRLEETVSGIIGPVACIQRINTFKAQRSVRIIFPP